MLSSSTPRKFRNRVHAGTYLAQLADLQKYKTNSKSTVVLALPRGGLPVAFPIAKELNASLDLLLVRKLGFPGSEEVAMGAIAVGGVKYLSDDIYYYGISQEQVNKVVEKESLELERRNQFYRNGAAPFDVTGKDVFIVDDGIATGATMMAALLALKAMSPRKLVVVSPVGAPDSTKKLAKIADEVVVPLRPSGFQAVGLWYDDFPQTEDQEVIDLLAKASTLSSTL